MKLVHHIDVMIRPSPLAQRTDHVRRLFAGKAELKRGAAVPRLSDRIGLPHCALAAKAGGFDVALRQEGHRIVFSVELDTARGNPHALLRWCCRLARTRCV